MHAEITVINTVLGPTLEFVNKYKFKDICFIMNQ